MLFADIFMLIFALWASFSMRLGTLYLPEETVFILLIVAPVIAIPIFIRLGLYRAIIRYIGFKALWTIIKAVSIYAVIWSALVFISGAVGVPRSVTLINWLAAILLIGSSRMVARWWFVGMAMQKMQCAPLRTLPVDWAPVSGLMVRMLPASELALSDQSGM